MIKKLTIQEVAEKLAKEGCFEGYVRDSEEKEWKKNIITGVDFDEDYSITTRENCWNFCGIEIPEEYEPYPDDECPPLNCGDIVVSKQGYPTELMVTMVTREGKDKHIYLFDWKDNKFLFDNYTNLDGSPIGKLRGRK